MDFVPFTLFFMVCLLSFQGKVSGKPASEADLQGPWDQDCDQDLRYKNYCTQKLTGNDHPSVEELHKLYNDNIGNFDFGQPYETETRDGINICRTYDKLVSGITMIRDANDHIRYTLYIPGLYSISILVHECQENATKMLSREYRDNHINCVSKSYQYPFIVLSQDKKSLELVKIKGVPSSCDPVQTLL